MPFDPHRVARALTGSFDVRRFDEEVREQRALRAEATIESADLSRLFNLDRLESLLASEAIPSDHVDLYQDGHLIRLTDVHKKSGRTALQIVAERFRDGATIRLRDVDAFDDGMKQFASAVHRLFASVSQVNVYLTPPGTTGFPPHFDITDVFVVQVLGAKEWRVFDDYSHRVELPAMDTNWEPDRFRPTAEPAAMTLSRGDVLYLPRGVMHQASCTDRASMHLTVSLTPLTYADLIDRELRRVAAVEIALRRRVPWSIDDDPACMRRIEETVRACLQSLERHLDVAHALEAERRPLRSIGEGTATGELAAALGALFEDGTAPASGASQHDSSEPRSHSALRT